MHEATHEADSAARWALVTGASSGIGLEFARALRRRGDARSCWWRVGRTDSQKLSAELGGEDVAVVIPADLAAPSGIAAVLEGVRARGLTIDLLVNNAGMGRTGRFVEQTPAVIRQMIDLNITSLVELTQASCPRWSRAAGARS